MNPAKKATLAVFGEFARENLLIIVLRD